LRPQDEWPARWASPTIMGYRCPSPKGLGWMNLWPVGPQDLPNAKGNLPAINNGLPIDTPTL
jgi:hypothetical protein